MKKPLLSVIAGGAVLLSFAVYALVGWSTFNPSSAAGFAAGNATIKGKVIYDGKPPKRKEIKVTEKKCAAHLHGKPIPADNLVVSSDGGIKWAFVYVKSGVKGKYDPPAKPVVLNQQGCMYTPHVFGAMVGQTIEVVNNDPLNHNIHGMPKKNKQWNFAQPKQGMKNPIQLTTSEVMIKIKCDVHPWMGSYCGILPHPFYSVTKDDGSFEIKNLPPGTYTIESWHENKKLGKKTEKVTVKAGETKEITFKYKPKSS
jgi:plastocyanin